jgi:beta-glucosidase
VDVKNTGSRAGDEVIQLYVTHLRSRVERPIKELKGFARVSLKPNESRTVQIPLKAEALAYWDEGQNQFVVEEETVRILLGTSSADVRVEKTIDVTR